MRKVSPHLGERRKREKIEKRRNDDDKRKLKESEVQKNSGSERYENYDDDEVGKKRNVKEN